uniref:Uncharacterized protein n=1 Tax=Arundo donax TaxID=35708 RepID=A0A0A9FD90_ARUDO
MAGFCLVSENPILLGNKLHMKLLSLLLIVPILIILLSLTFFQQASNIVSAWTMC